MKIIAVDLDNTLCTPISKYTAFEEIKECAPYKQLIKVINDLYKRGYQIIIYTHRHSVCTNETIKWLKKYRIKYHKVVYDKLGADVYIDDKAIIPSCSLRVEDIERKIHK